METAVLTRDAHRVWATVENRLHYVRDFTYDEDRCRAYVRHLPRNLACLTNVAIVRRDARFRYLPEANRHYIACAQDARGGTAVPDEPGRMGDLAAGSSATIKTAPLELVRLCVAKIY